ncbi:MAG: Wzz/FepE/Etk N-terminal domain-containing protein, partial [Deltaproteobacteria bacterium]
MEDKPSSPSYVTLLCDFWSLMMKRKIVVISITLSTGIAAVVASFFLTPVYRAETKILPPQMRHLDIFPQMAALNGYSMDLQRTALALNTPGYIYIGMLQSRTIFDRIIERFKLMDVYGSDYREDARKILAKAFRAEIGKYGIISVTVDDRDPKMAADIANAFIKELKQLTQSLAVTEASQRKLFFEQELKQVREELVLAEESMKKFQEKT